MVCHKKCLSKITINCSGQCTKKVSSITVSHTIYSQGKFCHHLHKLTNISVDSDSVMIDMLDHIITLYLFPFIRKRVSIPSTLVYLSAP